MTEHKHQILYRCKGAPKFKLSPDDYLELGLFVEVNGDYSFIKVLPKSPVYEWKVTFLSASSEWVLAHGWYKSTDEFIAFSKFEDDKACELIIQSKRLAQND